LPYTPKQTRYLLSTGSPLTKLQKFKMVGELHADPSLGKAIKGSALLKKPKSLQDLASVGGFNPLKDANL